MSTALKVSVVIPVLNEEDTIAAVVRAVAADRPHEVLVIDADSTDNSAARASEAGARVLNWRAILPTVTPRPGKGESLWRGTIAATGDIVCFIDGDLTAPPTDMVDRLSAPLIDDTIHLVKARYQRTLGGQPSGGGRVTELTARPLLALFFPELGDIAQPLAGEYAIRRSAALELPFVGDYGVEAGLLIDTCRRYGRQAIAEVDLPPRQHRNRPLDELAPMARTVAATIAQRAGKLESEHPHFPGERRAPGTV